MAISDNAQDEGLERVIGTGALGLSVVNMVVGAGIFALPGLVAAELGSAAILAYLICSVTVALVFLCFAEVADFNSLRLRTPISSIPTPNLESKPALVARWLFADTSMIR